MQIANIMIALGGDLGNTVPKYGVTAAEIAVLRAIHGDDAVFDIQPAGEVEMRNRDELLRLKLMYGSAKDRENKAHVEILYPGAAARVFETLDELDLVPEQFASTARAVSQEAPANAKAPAKAAVTDDVEDLDALSVEPVEEADDADEEMSAADKAKAARAAKAAAKAAKKDELFA